MKQEIKTTQLNIIVSTPTTIVGLEDIYTGITNAKKASDVTAPALELAQLYNQYEALKKSFKEAVKEHETKLKSAEGQLERAVTALKEKAIKVVSVKYGQKVNKETGVVSPTTEHDLNTTLFSFTPASKAAVLDTKEMMANPKKYKKYLKEVVSYEINFEAINQAKAEDLPYVEQDNNVKVSFKTKLSESDILKITAEMEAK